jgi:hypothetical protein
MISGVRRTMPLCGKRRSSRKNKRMSGGGNGYYLDPRVEQIAGQAVVVGYDSRVPPVFNGELMSGSLVMKGGKRKSKRRSSKNKKKSSKRRQR